MNKCEHGEKISTFCASECCVWKEAAGCEACIRKYHNHMGSTVFLGEEEVLALVRKYTMDSTIKPKCRVLQEAIYAYFSLIKNELSASLDAACKNIINQIGYPYLYLHATLSTYKRLKNKEYKKITQKDFRTLYELSQKISEKDLAKEEAKIYVSEMRLTEELITNLEDIVQRYDSVIKKYHPAFAHDSTQIAKINDIFRNLSDSPRSLLKPREDKKGGIGPIYSFKDRQEKPEPALRLETVHAPTIPVVSTLPDRGSAIGGPAALFRPNYSREVSLDKKITREHRFLGGTAPSAAKESPEESSSKGAALAQKTERMEVVRQELNNKEQEINEKKKMLMEMMKSKDSRLPGKAQ
jgi:hypothetical protein